MTIKVLLLLALLFSAFVDAKRKLVISKCILADGTISYQQDTCPKNSKAPHKTKLQQPDRTAKEKNTKKLTKKINKNPAKQIVKQTVKQAVKKTAQAKIATKPITYQKPQKNAKKPWQRLSEIVGDYEISINVLSNLYIFSKVYSEKLLHMKFLDKRTSTQFSVRIDFIFPDNKDFSAQEIDDLVYLLGNRFMQKSKEGRVNLQMLNVVNGKGSMATFLLNEPNYKYTTKGAIFKNKWLIEFTILSNSISDNNYKKTIEYMEKSIQCIKGHL